MTESTITEEERRELLGALLTGCDRTTARGLVGVSAGRLRRQLDHDARFARNLRRAEAAVEVHHMRNIYQAAKDEKNWRASVWWLEQKSPERFGRRVGSAGSERSVGDLVERLADVIVAEIPSAADREQLISRLLAAAEAEATSPAPPRFFDDERPAGDEGSLDRDSDPQDEFA